MIKTFLVLLIFVSSFVYGQFTNVRVDNPSVVSNPEEVTIAINPLHPEIIAAGSNLDYFYVSYDGGKSWTSKTLTSRFGVWGDPSIIFDGNGYIYFGHLSNPPKDGYWIDRIVVQRSVDSGKTFDNGYGIGFNSPKNQDKEWLACDLTNSPYRNNIYVTWTEFDHYGTGNPADSSRILFSRSTNSGESWSEPIVISEKSGNCIDSDSTAEGAVPAIGPNGEIYVAWSLNDAIYFDKSTDGGLTFGKDVFVTTQPGGWDFNVPGINRCDGLPITACDVSRSKYRGNIYIAWGDQRNGQDNSDVFLIKSTDGGNTWGRTVRVNNDTTSRHQFFPWMTVDTTNGNVYLVFYDRRNTTGNATEVYLARSTDGGETFQNFKISESPFTPSKYKFFGDYINIAAYKGEIRPIWMRLDNRQLSVWTAIINDDSLLSEVKTAGSNLCTDYELKQNYPNPANPATTIPYSLPRRSQIELGVYNVLGQKIRILYKGIQTRGNHEVSFNAENLASGVYFYYLRTSEKLLTRKMTILK